jgi:hypothetical protein
MTMSAPMASPWSGDSRTFLIATWNIRCGQNPGLNSAAKGSAQMGIGAAILTEMKITDNQYRTRSLYQGTKSLR